MLSWVVHLIFYSEKVLAKSKLRARKIIAIKNDGGTDPNIKKVA